MKNQNNVEINFSPEQLKTEKIYIKKISNYILKRIILPEGNISISFIDDVQMLKLNSTYRGKDSTTDVLTFNIFTSEILADIYISKEKVKKNATKYKYSYNKEILRVIAHAFAHVIGYDHQNIKDLVLMREYEDFVIKGFNYSEK